MPRPRNDKRRVEIFHFIRRYREEHGYSPSVREMAAEFGTSTSVIDYHVAILVDDGYVGKSHGLSRTLHILRDMIDG